MMPELVTGNMEGWDWLGLAEAVGWSLTQVIA